MSSSFLDVKIESESHSRHSLQIALFHFRNFESGFVQLLFVSFVACISLIGWFELLSWDWHSVWNRLAARLHLGNCKSSPITWSILMFWLVYPHNERDIFMIWAWLRGSANQRWLVNSLCIGMKGKGSTQQVKTENSQNPQNYEFSGKIPKINKFPQKTWKVKALNFPGK